MKNNIFIILLITIFSSCTKLLDQDPISDIGSKAFYSNTEEVELATIAIYDGLQAIPMREFALTEMRSDNTKSKTGEGDWGQFENFTIVATNQAVASYWSANYNVIFRSNKVIENIDVVTNTILKNRFEGEAKFTRALAHFNLVRAYGDIPILDKTIGIDETEYFDRDPVINVIEFIISDLEDAVQKLPIKSSSIDFGRATKGAAEALLSKVYLTNGDYSLAESLLSSIIASASYRLETSYEDVFYKEGNDEIIFAIPYLDNDINESQDFSFEMTNGGVRSGLNYLTDDFINKMDPLDVVRNPVLRSPLNSLEVGKFINSGVNARLCGNDWIVLRLADVYLMHTEAIMAGMNTTQNIEAISSFNKVRERVGLSLVAEDGTGEIDLKMLLKERRYELAFENHRFYDLVRTNTAQTTLSDYADAEGYIFTSTDLLLPLPQGEINVSGGSLIQNPGY